MNSYFCLVGVCLLSVYGVKGLEKKPCCWAPQYQWVWVYFQEDYSGKQQEYINNEGAIAVVRDNINNYESLTYNENFSNSGNVRYRRIRDFDNKMQYNVFNSSYCERSTITAQPQTQCVNANATFVRQSYYGYGDNKLSTDTWTWTDTYVERGSLVHMDVTTNGCIPVRMSRRGRTTDSPYVFAHFFAYINYEVGIRDDNVFKIPDECQELNEHDMTMIG